VKTIKVHLQLQKVVCHVSMQIDTFERKVGFCGTAISPKLLQKKELTGKVATKFSLRDVLVGSDKKKTQTYLDN